MAHPLHHGFGSAHLFLLSLVLCSHIRAALSALLEKMGSVPNREGNHANVRLGRAMISGLVHLRCMRLERCIPKVTQYPHRDISPSLCSREGELTQEATVESSVQIMSSEPEKNTSFGRPRLNQSPVYTYLFPLPFLPLTSKRNVASPLSTK